LRTIRTDANAYTNCNCDAELHNYAYGHCDAQPHNYANTNRNFNRVTHASSNTYTKNSPDPEESTNTTPASIEGITNESNQRKQRHAAGGPFRNAFSVFATTLCRGLSLSR
jgi:hypothetical protein